MLVLGRKAGEQIVIDGNIVVEVVKIKGNRVTLGVVAPRDVRVMRDEISAAPANAPYTFELEVEDGVLVA